MPAKRIKLGLIGVDQLARDCLRHSLPKLDPRLVCVRDFACDMEVLGGCRETELDLVIFDLSSRSVCELQVLKEISLRKSWGLLVIAHHAPDHVLEELVTRKRSGFFSRDNSLNALVQAVSLVALGGTYIDGPLHELLVRRTIGEGQRLGLSNRERHVLQLIAQGHSTKEVAVILSISGKTVDKYRTSVMQKLNVHDVVRLTHCAIRLGFIRV